MSGKIDNENITSVTYNGVTVNKIVYDGSIAWCRPFSLEIFSTNTGVDSVYVNRISTDEPTAEPKYLSSGETIYYDDLLNVSAYAKTGYTIDTSSFDSEIYVSSDLQISPTTIENSYGIYYRNGNATGGSLTLNASTYQFSGTDTDRVVITQYRKYTQNAILGTNSGTRADYTVSGHSVEYRQGVANASATIPSTQTATDTWKWTADGWTTSYNSTAKVYESGDTITGPSTSSVTLYPCLVPSRKSYGSVTLATNSMAKSNTTQNGYQVKYNLGTADSASTVPSTQTATDTISYDANGWNAASDGSGANYSSGQVISSLSSSLILYPKYTSSTTRGSVTLATNNMTKANTSGTTYTVTYYVGTANANSTVPSMQSATDTVSYDANGWNAASDGSGTHYNNGATYTATANLSLYPQFSSSTTHGSVTLETNSMNKQSTLDATYTVTYNNNDGSGTTSTATASKRRNYTANGWTTTSGSTTRNYTSGQSVSVSANINLYPCFSSSTSTDSIILKSLTRTGYTHGGWNTKSDGAGTHYNKSTSHTPTGDITLYAEWTVNTYKITLAKNLGTNASGVWKNSSNTTISAIANVAYGTSISVSGNTLTVGSDTYTWVPSADSHYHVSDSSISCDYTSMPATGFTITGNATAAIDTFAMYFENGDYGAWYNGNTASTAPITGIAYGTTITYSKDANQSNSSTSGTITWTVTIGNQTRTYKSPSANAQYYYGITANQTATTVAGNMTFKPTVTRNTHTYSMTFTNNTGGTWDSTTALTVNYGTAITYTNNSQSNSNTSGKATWVVKVGTTTRTFTVTNSANAQYYYGITPNQSAATVGGAMEFKPTVSTSTHTYTMSFTNNTYGTWDSNTSFSVNYGTSITYTKGSNQTNSSTSGTITWVVKVGSTTRTFTTNAANAQYYYSLTANQSASTVSGSLDFKPTVGRSTHTYSVSFTNPSYGSWGSATKTVAYGVTWSTNGTTVTFSDGQTNTVTKSSPTARTLTFTELDSGGYGSWNSTDSVSIYDYSYTTPTIGNGSGTVTGTATITASNSRSAVTFTNTLSAQPTNASTSGAQTWTISGTNTAGNSFSRVYTMAENTAQYYYYINARSYTGTSVTANTEFKATTARVAHTYTLTITINSNISYIEIEYDQGSGGTETYSSSTTKTLSYGQIIYATAYPATGYQISGGSNLNDAITVTSNLTVSATASQQQRTMTFTNGTYGSWNSTASLTVYEGTTITYTKSNDQTNSTTSGTITWKVTIGSTTRTYTTPAATAQYYYGITANQSASSVSADMNFKPTVSRSTHTYSMTFANGSYGSWNSTTSLTVNYGTSISYTKSANQTNSTVSGTMTWKVTIGSTTRTYTTPSANSTYYYEMSANQSASSVSGAMQFKPTVTRKTHTSGSWHTLFSGDFQCGFEWNATYTENIVSNSHLTSSARIRVTIGWYLIDINGNVLPIGDDTPDFYGETSLDGPYNDGMSGVANTYIDIYVENGSLMVDTTTENVNAYTQYLQIIDVTKVEVYY